MSTDPEIACVVCGKAATMRCSRCGDVDLDLLFCSPAHQKLVWPAHRLVCGSGKANPFIHPDLSEDEAAMARKSSKAELEHVDIFPLLTPVMADHAVVNSRVSLARLQEVKYGVGPGEFVKTLLPLYRSWSAVDDATRLKFGLDLADLRAWLYIIRRELRSHDAAILSLPALDFAAFLEAYMIKLLVLDDPLPERPLTELRHRLVALAEIIRLDALDRNGHPEPALDWHHIRTAFGQALLVLKPLARFDVAQAFKFVGLVQEIWMNTDRSFDEVVKTPKVGLITVQHLIDVDLKPARALGGSSG
ncbi:hypothetical protein JCM9279_004068 [Rhodotorula babjevae]